MNTIVMNTVIISTIIMNNNSVYQRSLVPGQSLVVAGIRSVPLLQFGSGGVVLEIFCRSLFEIYCVLILLLLFVGLQFRG